MSNDGFKFQYKIGDHVKTNFGDDNDLVCFRLRDDEPSFMCTERGCELIPTSGTVITPINKTLERYDAEYLAWQQPRIAVGDWVERIVSETASGLDCFMAGYKFQVSRLYSEKVAIESVSGALHHIENLKPCKPPKPELIKSENFQIMENSICLRGSNWIAGVISKQGGVVSVSLSQMGRTPDELIEIAGLANEFDASVAPA